MKKNLLLTMLTMLLCIFGAQATWAQGITTAFINGKVVDEKGEGIPGATVVAVHEPSGSQYATATLNDGRFNLPNVRIGGPYTIKASFVGTKDQTLENLFLSLGQTYTANFELAENSTELQEVVVSGLKDPIFNSDRTGAGTNITSSQLSNMPTLSRNFTDMTRLVPQSSGTSFAGRNNLYNNLTIDGSLFNNAFGLASLPGGQTNSQPISLDALEEIQVNVAPFDVRQGGFTGAAINAVTRSGTNDFSGSAYYFTRNQSLVGQRVSGNEIPVDNFNFSQVGMRVGGPIIKNKLFFFASGELERRNDPFGNFVANRGTDGANVSLVNGTAADGLANFLRSRENSYDPGPIDGYQAETGSDKFLARLDWNINNNHRLTVRYNFLQSRRDVPASGSGSQGGRANSRNSLPFRNANYIINNNYNSVVAELNSTIGNKFSNNLIIGWTGFRDFRETPGGVYPFVDIENGSNQQAVAFGNELFSVNNLLNQDVFQFTNNFNVFLGKHTLTFGTSNEYYRFENGFMPAFHSRYRFPTLNAFYNSFPAGTAIPTGPEITVNPDGSPRLMANQTGISDGTGRPTFFEYRYSAVTDEVPLARFEALQLGFYAQDEWQVADNFKLTTGVRIDVPIFTKDAEPNAQANEITFLNNERFDFSKFPSAYVMFSPRVGFNWDVKNDKSIQVRGGTGVFSGRIPFVWMSNQASNTGALFGTINPGFNANGLADFPFQENVFAYKPADAIGRIPATYALNVTAQNFRFPQVWRSNLATDFKLPYGIVATLEAGITADLNAVYVRNANLGPAVGTVAGDGRVRYAGGANSRLNANILENIVLDNNNQGWSAFLTAQVQKDFGKGFFASAAYNFGPSYDLNSGNAATAGSFFTGNPVVGNPNEPVLSYSGSEQLHRFFVSGAYKVEYAKNFATGISLFFEGRSGNRFSYTYGGDLNGDNVTGNDLMYIPRDQSEIILVPTNAADLRTPQQIWEDLNAYIEQDKYLSANRGQYAARNGAQAPWIFRMDLRIFQDFYIETAGKRNTLQFSLDIFNFANMLNSDWGVIRTPIRSQLLNFVGTETNTGRPIFTYNPTTVSRDGVIVERNISFQDSINNFASQWQAQFGVRYIFN
jgi:hypothetical protein